MGGEFLRTVVFTKVIVPPEGEFKGLEIKPPNYLIQDVDRYNFVLCEEIKQTEVEWFKEEQLIEYEGKTYVKLANLLNEEKAMNAIKLLWRATKEVNVLSN